MFCFASLWVREIEKLEEDLWNDYETVCQEFNHRNGEENDSKSIDIKQQSSKTIMFCSLRYCIRGSDFLLKLCRTTNIRLENKGNKIPLSTSWR